MLSASYSTQKSDRGWPSWFSRKIFEKFYSIFKKYLFSIGVLNCGIVPLDENILNELHRQRRFTDTTSAQHDQLVLLHSRNISLSFFWISSKRKLLWSFSQGSVFYDPDLSIFNENICLWPIFFSRLLSLIQLLVEIMARFSLLL